MSCNGCRVLRKGCSETCILRPCLQWIESAKAQGHATLFVAKFFGRAGLMSFISAVPELNRPALFQSLLFEACGRTVNPVNGAVGMLWSGNWHVCQAAVETVLCGGTLRPLSDLVESPSLISSNEISRDRDGSQNNENNENQESLVQLDLTVPVVPAFLLPPLPFCKAVNGERPGSPSEESVTTSCCENGIISDGYRNKRERKLLNLFV